MTAESRQKDFEQRNQYNGGEHRYVVDNNTGGYYLVECQNCGDVYPSNECHGGESIADSGDYGDCSCPHCGETEPEECGNAALAWNVQQKRILDLEAEIASLRESHSQVIQSGDHYKMMAEDGIRLLSGKVLSVKLTDCDLGAVQHMSGGSKDYCNGFVDGTQNAVRAVTSACTAVGLKCQIEEK